MRRTGRGWGIPGALTTLVALVVLVALVEGCTSQPAQPTAPGHPTSETPSQQSQQPPQFPWARYQERDNTRLWRVDSGVSRLTVLVYKTGPLQRLGHNHVVESRDLMGYALQATPLSDSYADLYLPLAGLIVDDPSARAAAGPAFESIPTPQAIHATRANMLGARLLNAEVYPWVHMHVGVPDLKPDLSLSAKEPQMQPARSSGVTQARVEIELAGHRSIQPVPVSWWWSPDEVRLESRFTLTHGQLGLTPFSAVGGALRVQQELQFHLELSLKPASLPVTLPGA